MTEGLVFDCSFGAGANMLIAALLGLADNPEEEFQQASSVLDKDLIEREGYELIFEQRREHGMSAYYFDCQDHVHEHSHSHPGNYAHSHAHDADASSHHHHDRPARGPQDLHDLIDNSNFRALTPLHHLTTEDQHAAISTLAHKIVDFIAQAEARAHGISSSEVHFHELGAIDCYVDIMLFATLITRLQPADMRVLSLAEGTGTHRCAHGEMSLPGMAVTQLLTGSDLELTIIPHQGEHLTPTAVACLVAAGARPLKGELGAIKAMGVSCGSRRFAHPNLARVYRTQQRDQCDASTEPSSFVQRNLLLVESNIDDSTPQMIAHAIEKLFSLGTRDTWSEPIVMKKGRSAVKLCALIDPEKRDDVLTCLVTETTAIGARTVQVDRFELAREMVTCTINGKTYQAKKVILPVGTCSYGIGDHTCNTANGGASGADGMSNPAYRIYPEHDEVVRLSHDAGISYPEALSLMEATLREMRGL